MTSGYLYFFAIGDIPSLKGDILIMEEAEATPRKIRAIHAAGKEAIVWTVNTPSSISKFVNSEIDGIISDHPRAVLEAMQESRSLSDYRAIRQKIFGY